MSVMANSAGALYTVSIRPWGFPSWYLSLSLGRERPKAWGPDLMGPTPCL